MPQDTNPSLNKLPFLVDDALLVLTAAWLATSVGPGLDPWRLGLVAVCVALGAWLGALPFILEHRAQVRLAEASGLADTVEQVKGLQTVGSQVAEATARWQSVQASADKTAATAKEIATQITTEARHFAETMQKAHDAEIRNLRLEVEKMRRSEGDWLQVIVRMLDNVYALYSAGVHSGQPGLVEQFTQFQNTCRDAARRVGLVAVEAVPDAPFDKQVHQLPEGVNPVEGGRIAQTLATGYTYQGQFVRPVLVLLKQTDLPQPADPQLPLEETPTKQTT